MAQLVEGDVAQRHILFQLRRTGNPVCQALGQDQRVITKAQRVVGHVLTGFRGTLLCGQGDVLGPECVAWWGPGSEGPVASLRARGAAGEDAGGGGVAAQGLCHKCFTPSLLV